MTFFEVLNIISDIAFAIWLLLFVLLGICFVIREVLMREDAKQLKKSKDEAQTSNVLDEEEKCEVISVCCSVLDALITEQAEILGDCYDVPDDVEVDGEDVNYARTLLSFYSFMMSHGIGAYIKYLNSEYSFDEKAIYERVTESSDKTNEQT